MTNKQKIQNLVSLMPEDISWQQAIYRMVLLRNVEEGLAEAAQGLGKDHDELMAELEKEDAQMQAALDASRSKRSPRDKNLHRRGLAKKRSGVRKSAHSGSR
jgi:predicted transcriptional regulator